MQGNAARWARSGLWHRNKASDAQHELYASKRKCSLTNLHTRPHPGVAVPNGSTQRPVAITGRRSVVARLRSNDTANNTAEDGSTRVITVVMVVMMMMMILGEAHARRLLLRASRIIGFEQRHRVGDRFEKIAIICRWRGLGCWRRGCMGASDSRQGRRRPK